MEGVDGGIRRLAVDHQDYGVLKYLEKILNKGGRNDRAPGSLLEVA